MTAAQASAQDSESGLFPSPIPPTCLPACPAAALPCPAPAQIGLVSQTPTLFASSIFDNIALASGAGMERVVQAAMAANAHGFISKLPNGWVRWRVGCSEG